MISCTDSLIRGKGTKILNIFIFVAEVIVKCQCSANFDGENGYCYKPGKKYHGIHIFSYIKCLSAIIILILFSCGGAKQDCRGYKSLR